MRISCLERDQISEEIEEMGIILEIICPACKKSEWIDWQNTKKTKFICVNTKTNCAKSNMNFTFRQCKWKEVFLTEEQNV